MSAEEYQARAELAKRQARTARNDEERKAYLEIAHLWWSLAERAPEQPRQPGQR